MKKILSFLIIVFLIVSGVGAVAVHNENESEIVKTCSSKITFSSLRLKETDTGYVEVELEGVSTFLMEPGKPMLPKVVKTFELPFGVKNVRVEVTPMGDVIEKQFPKEIRPSPRMLPLTMVKTVDSSFVKQEKDVSVYSSDGLYPSSWYEYSIRCGLNEENERVTHLIIPIYPVRYIPSEGKIQTVKGVNVKVTYETFNNKKTKTAAVGYDLVVVAPKIFEKYLQRLVDHKNHVGVKTFLKTTEDIYNEYRGRDKPEKIKYFIKDAIEKYNIKYVLLVGGLKSQFYAKPRDDCNQGSKGWYLPVRYTNLYDNPKFPLDGEVLHDPGVLSDLYYADIYESGGNFSSWDPNCDGVFAAWGKPGVSDDLGIDLLPDVCVGRLPCRNVNEVKTVVDKIINYESTPVHDTDWFNKVTVVSGDGFIDQQDLDIRWDTTGLPNDYYIIYGQSINKKGEKGPVDTIKIQIDRTKETRLTFNHDDHLNPALQNGYPAPPITEIVSVSPGDVLGYTDYTYTPGEDEAYCNDFNPWANISYVNGVLTIRGKSYDPEPYGNVTNVHVWVKNMKGEVIFSEWRNNTETYYEGEWTTGEKLLCGRGGALYYMPSVFKREILWASNGNFTGQDDVLSALNRGCGFLFMSGHGSPNVWADHFPGVPGNRKYGSVTGLRVTSLQPWKPFMSKPLFPIDTLSNGEKLPVAVIGGCHNSMFNVSMVLSFYDIFPYLFKFLPKPSMWSFGVPAPECFSWRLIRNPHGGAIASMGNTGLGYGMPGKMATVGGGDSWITIEFFKQYGAENHSILGESYTQALVSYIHTFDMSDFEAGHPKTVEQWVLFGDPSLKIGGYSS
ncbi:MAG: peptidase C25 [Thermoplasmata archaeon]|nr:MAG: peptidase C25 [Thermoplasmata archaeon]RLF35976.1 MAG: peptidase C25 [Thermoplasmata archaeon]RLF51553.1 MAG: peptidase C25 [Thermoplasmata archaeon]